MGMQKILNSKERNEAFLKFLLFFCITVALVIVAVYFNFRLPLKENSRLRERITLQTQEEMKQGKFVENMDKAMVYLDSLDKDKKNIESIDLMLNGKINDLAKLQEDGYSPYARMNKVIIEKMIELKEQKKQYIRLYEKTKDLPDIESKLRNAEAQLSQKQQELDQLRRGAGF